MYCLSRESDLLTRVSTPRENDLCLSRELTVVNSSLFTGDITWPAPVSTPGFTQAWAWYSACCHNRLFPGRHLPFPELKLFLPCLQQWSLSDGKEMFGIVVPLRTEKSSIPYFVHLDKLWVVLKWGVRDVLIYSHNGKSRRVSLILPLFNSLGIFEVYRDRIF